MRLLRFLLFLLWTTALCRGDQRLHAPVVTYVGYTGSMRPALVGGEHILILPWPISWVRLDQMVVYYNGRINVIHRVEAIVRGSRRRLIVKGDHNDSEDRQWVDSRTLVGLALVLPHL